MQFTFSKNPIDRLACWAHNKYEDFARWYWHKSPHHVECCICGDTLRSDEDHSPEECGWKNFKGTCKWVCHACEAHRDFKPYIDIIDIDDDYRWMEPGASVVYRERLTSIRREEIRKIAELVGEPGLFTKCWVVTTWSDGEEPIVSAFDNTEAANSYYEYCACTNEESDGCCIDEVPIYKQFIVTDE